MRIRRTSEGGRHWVAVVVGHQLAHQWFINLVRKRRLIAFDLAICSKTKTRQKETNRLSQSKRLAFKKEHEIVRSKTTVDATAGRQQRSSRPTEVKQHFRPEAAHTVADMESSALSRAIRDFLGRADDDMNEWSQLNKSRSSRRLTRHRSTSSRSNWHQEETFRQ